MAKRAPKTKTLFCYVCKRHITVSVSKDKTPEQVFRDSGHYGEDNKVPFLEPNLGRTSRRHAKAVKTKKDEAFIKEVRERG